MKVTIEKSKNFAIKNSIYFILGAIFIISSLLNENFLTVLNLRNVLRQISVITILAFGETLLIIGGMIDLSVGAVFAVAGILSIKVFLITDSLVLALLTGILAGVALNIISGFLVSYFKTPPFIATLALMTMARGFVLLITKGQNIYQIGRYIEFGQGSIGFIPTPVIFMFIMLAITWYTLNHTRLGRSIYAIGGNEEAAMASGIQVPWVKFIVYLINGAFVGLAGVLFMSRVNAGLPNAGIGFELDALTVAIIGGTSFSGGIGTAAGTLAGGFIIGLLNNIMNLVGVNSYVQQIIKGAIIALAVIFDMAAKNRRARVQEN
ncbi:MAG: ABC transporter permease [Sphaerochaetaceae bacterium]|nr:ABC transporter permease [Sphaerochaetaceae bacterium]